MRSEKIEMFPDDTDRLMDTEEVRLRLGVVDKGTVFALISSGELPSLRMGRRVLVRKVTFNKFLADHEGQDIRELAKQTGEFRAG